MTFEDFCQVTCSIYPAVEDVAYAPVSKVLPNTSVNQHVAKCLLPLLEIPARHCLAKEGAGGRGEGGKGGGNRGRMGGGASRGMIETGVGGLLVRLLDLENGPDLMRALVLWALEMMRESVLRPGSLPPMHPYVTSSLNAVDILSLYKTCVDGRKKDREALSADVALVGRLVLLLARESAPHMRGTDTDTDTGTERERERGRERERERERETDTDRQTRMHTDVDADTYIDAYRDAYRDTYRARDGATGTDIVALKDRDTERVIERRPRQRGTETEGLLRGRPLAELVNGILIASWLRWVYILFFLLTPPPTPPYFAPPLYSYFNYLFIFVTHCRHSPTFKASWTKYSSDLRYASISRSLLLFH